MACREKICSGIINVQLCEEHLLFSCPVICLQTTNLRSPGFIRGVTLCYLEGSLLGTGISSNLNLKTLKRSV